MRLLRATSFRSALAYTFVLVAAVALVLGVLYTQLQTRLMDMQDALVWRETASLSRIYETQGAKALAEAVNSEQGIVVRASTSLGSYLAGNLQHFPSPETTQSVAGGWLHFSHQNDDGSHKLVRARLVRLDSDLVLLVGYDRHDTEAFLANMLRWFGLALLGLTVIGLSGAAWLAWRNLRRVAAMNEDLQPVMDGQLTSRLVARGGDEWALMAQHINTMLNRLESLMMNTRQVSDNLAHDLRAPVTRLKARLDVLLEQADEGARDQLADALDDVDALLRSFTALLTLSRLDSGVSRLVRQPIDLPNMCESLHNLFEVAFADKQMELRLHITDTGARFMGDEALLVQAMVNVLENALTHACVAGSTVTLSLHGRDGGVDLSLADGGGGIAPDKYAEVQKRFVRLDESRSGEGNGLGLSLVAAICQHHGGTLSLADNAPGLIVTLQLPSEA